LIHQTPHLGRRSKFTRCLHKLPVLLEPNPNYCRIPEVVYGKMPVLYITLAIVINTASNQIA